MTSNTVYPLATSSWGTEEIDAINDVVASGRFTMGEKVATFEKEFAEYFGSKHAVMVNSGSTANLLMVALLKWSSHFGLGIPSSRISSSLWFGRRHFGWLC